MSLVANVVKKWEAASPLAKYSVRYALTGMPLGLYVYHMNMTNGTWEPQSPFLGTAENPDPNPGPFPDRKSVV